LIPIDADCIRPCRFVVPVSGIAAAMGAAPVITADALLHSLPHLLLKNFRVTKTLA
jgi:hypothetical protein